MLSVVYNRTPTLLSKWIMTFILCIWERLQQNVIVENTFISLKLWSPDVLLEPIIIPYSAGSLTPTSCLWSKAERTGGNYYMADWDSKKYLMVKAQFSVPLNSMGWMKLHTVTICIRLGEILRKWKFFTLWTFFKLQDKTDGDIYSKEPFVAFGFQLQLVPKTSNLSQLQGSYNMVISLIGRQNKMTLRHINEVNYDVAGASLTYFVGNGFA